jgi:hypothetical protein
MIYRPLAIGLLSAPPPELYGCIVAIDLEGRIVATLQDPGGAVIHSLTSVSVRDGLLYLGGLQIDPITTVPRPGSVAEGASARLGEVR